MTTKKILIGLPVIGTIAMLSLAATFMNIWGSEAERNIEKTLKILEAHQPDRPVYKIPKEHLSDSALTIINHNRLLIKRDFDHMINKDEWSKEILGEISRKFKGKPRRGLNVKYMFSPFHLCMDFVDQIIERDFWGSPSVEMGNDLTTVHFYYQFFGESVRFSCSMKADHSMGISRSYVSEDF